MVTDQSPLLSSSSRSRTAGPSSNSMDQEDDGHNATVFSSICNLLNTILGTGMLAMPHAVAAGGALPGAFTILFSGLTAGLGLFYLSLASTKTPRRQASFFALSQLTFPAAAKLFDAAIAIKCFGVSVSYLIILGALLPKVMLSFVSDPPEILIDRRFWILICMIILVPLSFLRTLHALRFTSYIALIAVADLMIIIIWKFFDRTDLPPRGDIELGHLSTGLITSLPVYIFAFTCAQNVFTIINEMHNNTTRRVNKAIVGSIGSATAIYEVIGILGYLTFGNTVRSNIAEMFPNGFLVAICRIGIVLLVLFSYPLQVHPCRASLNKVIKTEQIGDYDKINGNNNNDSISNNNTTSNDDDENDDEIDVRGSQEYRYGAIADEESSCPEEQSRKEEEADLEPIHHKLPSNHIPLVRFIITTTIILITSFMIALNISQLDVVLSFIGSTGSTTISFILPSLFYLKLFPERKHKSQIVLRGLAYALLVFGVVVMVACLTINIITATNS